MWDWRRVYILAFESVKVRDFDVDPRAIHNCRENLKKIEVDVDANSMSGMSKRDFPPSTVKR